jgi:lipopolysaccharide transport system permease protein
VSRAPDSATSDEPRIPSDMETALDSAPTDAATAEPAARPWVENRAPSGWLPGLPLGELWRFRELALVLALRDLKVRYKQTAFGVVWVVLQPLAAAVIFTIVFGRLADLPSEGLPYAVFVYSGLVLWAYFSGSLDSVSQSLVQNRDLVTKTYFPALVAPLAMVLPGLVDLAVSLVVVAVFMAIYGVAPGAAIVLLPFWIGACVVVVVAAGLWLSALNVQYRDVRHTMTFLLQVWLFASPVVYASSLVEGGWRYVYALNPMVTVLNGYRWSLAGAPAPGAEALVSLAVLVVVLATGLVYFLRAERRFADVI